MPTAPLLPSPAVVATVEPPPASTIAVELWPQSTVYAHARQLAPNTWVGYAASRGTFGAWDVYRVLDRGVTRTFDALAADFPDRAAAEQYALNLATGGAM